MPTLLALDTSADTGHVAVARAGRVLARAELARKGAQAATLVPVIGTVLAEAGVDRRELDGVVVGEGPGSFTGVRVAAATAKGVARALGIPLWGVPSVAAAALSDDGVDATVAPVRYVLFDARGDRVYGACYRVDPDTHRLETLVAPHGGELGQVLERDLPAGAVFTGDAAVRHRAVIEATGHTVVGPPLGLPTADALVAWMTAHPEAEPIGDADTWEPRYVRASNAEREWTP